MKLITSILLLLLFTLQTHSQQVIQPKIEKSSWLTDTVHSPKKAAYLALLPGLGQAYNRKFWKIPIVYAALGTTSYFVYTYNKDYQMFRDAYALRTDTIASNDTFTIYKTESLRLKKNEFWKKRDLMVLITAGVYMLNILDAVVDAHLYTFDLSGNLALQVKPQFGINSFNQNIDYGLTFKLKF